MAHWSEGTLIGFDLETTGVAPFTDVPVSYAFVTFEHGDRAGTVSSIVNPGRPIPPGATGVHGITDDRAAGGPALDEALDVIAATIGDAGRSGTPVVGMNLSYDLTMVDAMLRRRTGSGLADDVPLGPVVDCMVLDKQADRYRRGGRKLGDLCREYGVEHGGAHDAAADVEASVRVTLALLSRYPALAGMSLDDLVRAQATWKREQTAGLSEYFVGRGGEAIPEWQHQWPVGRRSDEEG